MADRVGKVPGRKPEVTAHVVGRFESCAIRQGRAGRVLDDGSGPENRRTFTGLAGSSPAPSAPGCAIRPADGTGFETRRATMALQVRLLPHPLACSSGRLEHPADNREIGGSNPPAPTNHPPAAPDWTGTGLLIRTEGVRVLRPVPGRRWRNGPARLPSKETAPGSSPGRRTRAPLE
jgi:hypothetical protein